MEIIDFNECKENARRYGGMAGLKAGIIYNNENWILKKKKSTKNFKVIEISYTTAPLSEFIGSQIYKLIGIDVHETLLGVRDGILVVACKDFREDNETLYEFREIKNAYVKGLEEELEDYSSSGTGTDINEIITVMNVNTEFICNPKLKERFWDMFIVDAFIGNNDRNNGNWGILSNNSNGISRIAPVYDNGGSFNNSTGDEKFQSMLENEEKFINSAYNSRTCVFYDGDKKINPLKYIEKTENFDCNEALLRVIPRIDLEKINELIEQIPEEYEGIKIISKIQKEFYKETLKYRFENVFIPVYDKIITMNEEEESEEEIEE